MASRLMNQSTIYRRHEARLARTIALKDDTRPAIVRVLSGLPGFCIFIPPYQPSMEAAAAPTSASSLVDQLPAFAGDTFFKAHDVLEQQEESTSDKTSVVLAAAISGGISEFLSTKASDRPLLPRSLLGYLTGSSWRSPGSAHIAMHDVLDTQHQDMLPRHAVAVPGGVMWQRVLGGAGTCALLFGTRSILMERLGESAGAASSAIAGAALATIRTPFEAIRAQLNLQHASRAVTSNSFAGAANDLIHRQGISGLTKGASVVFPREMLGVTIYFGSYEGLKRTLSDDSNEASRWAVGTAGALAGSLYRGFTYAVDSLCMPSSLGVARGVLPAILRAAPANAVLFLGYESILCHVRQER